jgi:hypothetical protein
MIAPQGARARRRAGQRWHVTAEAMQSDFLALGNMGRAMAANLLRRHQMRVWDRPGCRRGAPLRHGRRGGRDPAEAFDAVVVFTMLAKAAVVGPPRPSLCRQS